MVTWVELIVSRDARSMYGNGRLDCGIQKSAGMTLEAIKYCDGRLEILNQLVLPTQSVYEHITSVEKAWEAIHTMKVCG